MTAPRTLNYYGQLYLRADAEVTLEFAFPNANDTEQFWPALAQLGLNTATETRNNHAVVTAPAAAVAQVVQLAQQYGGTQAAKVAATTPPTPTPHKKCPPGSHWDGTKCVQVPGLGQWNTYAGGTGAAEGKHGHDIQMAHGKYSISPVSNRRGKHMGYVANFAHHSGDPYTPVKAVPRHLAPGLHSRLTSDGTPDPTHYHYFRHKRDALTAVRKHFDRAMTESEPA